MVFPKKKGPPYAPKGLEKGVPKFKAPVAMGQYRGLVGNQGAIVIEHKKSLENSRPKIRQARGKF